jgi:hypothetical protein
MTQMRALMWILGGAFGLVWWLISLALGAKSYGILGTSPLAGPVSGVGTGLVMTALSIPVYRLGSRRALLWYSPLSVYLAIAVYGAFILVIRWLTADFHPDQLPFQVGLQSVLGMWWGTTFLLQIAIPVHLIAYGTHRMLRSALLTADRRVSARPSRVHTAP